MGVIDRSVHNTSAATQVPGPGTYDGKFKETKSKSPSAAFSRSNKDGLYKMTQNNIGPGKYTNIDPSVSSRSARVTQGKFGQQSRYKNNVNDAPGPDAY